MRSDRATPATVYTSRPKATPDNGSRTADTHDRVLRDRVDVSGKITLRHGGRLYSIGIGRTRARTRVLVQDRNIRIIHAATGELLRELKVDPAKRDQYGFCRARGLAGLRPEPCPTVPWPCSTSTPTGPRGRELDATAMARLTLP